MKSTSVVVDKQPLIIFIDDDFRRIVKNYNDPMVIHAIIVNANVSPILIDQGNSVDILSYEAFQKMKFCDANLLPHDTTLVIFTSDRINPRGYDISII